MRLCRPYFKFYLASFLSSSSLIWEYERSLWLWNFTPFLVCTMPWKMAVIWGTCDVGKFNLALSHYNRTNLCSCAGNCYQCTIPELVCLAWLKMVIKNMYVRLPNAWKFIIMKETGNPTKQMVTIHMLSSSAPLSAYFSTSCSSISGVIGSFFVVLWASMRLTPAKALGPAHFFVESFTRATRWTHKIKLSPPILPLFPDRHGLAWSSDQESVSVCTHSEFSAES